MNHSDIQTLCLWWALSRPVGVLAERAATHPREIAGVIAQETTVAVGEIPGSIDAPETARLRARTGDSSLFCVIQPSPTWLSGPNRVLAVTLASAHRIINAAQRSMSGGAFDILAAERNRLLESALRVSSIREVLASPVGRMSLTSSDRRQSCKARTPIYRLANNAAQSLRGIQNLDHEAITLMLSDSLLPALESWKKFELGTALACVDALARVSGIPASLDFSFSSRRPLAKIGDVSVWWQRISPMRPYAALDEGERIARQVAESLSVIAGSGRADCAVEKSGRVLSLIECKWSDFGESSAAIVDACEQLSRYARDESYRSGVDAMDLLSRSLISLAQRGRAPRVTGPGLIGCVDLSDLAESHLDQWAERVLQIA